LTSAATVGRLKCKVPAKGTLLLGPGNIQVRNLRIYELFADLTIYDSKGAEKEKTFGSLSPKTPKEEVKSSVLFMLFGKRKLAKSN